jgi:Cof subfamily protein (haloacid dehalogenase superfamily)
MKTLYVSDLDGTLFNSEKRITKFTVDVINKFIDQGGLFTIATARMAYGCDYKLREIKLNTPGIIMNGACIYSFDKKKYIDVKTIENAKVIEIEDILDEQDCNAFMYSFEDTALSIYYKIEADSQDAQYLSKRALEECREIKKVNSFTRTAMNRQVIYFALTGQERKIQDVWHKVSRITGIESVMYLNIYNGLYCLEIFDANANKANALMNLKQLLQVDEVVAFGDNHNDIAMMKTADFCFAPENAVIEVKRIANRIIESCDDDGVAKYIKQKYEL